MAFVEFIIACALALVGAWAVYFLASSLLSGIRPFIGLSKSASSGSNRKLKKAQKRVETIDELIRNQEYPLALKELEQAFMFAVSETTAQIRSSRDHNQAMLSRCLVVGDNIGARSEALPRVEKLLLERTELQALRLKTKEAFQAITSKREQRGKELPSWSKSEHQKKMKDIEVELKRNLKELEEALSSMFLAFEKQPSPDNDITYH